MLFWKEALSDRIRSLQSTYFLILCAYLVLVRLLRYRRQERIVTSFGFDKRPLSSMKTQEAFEIMRVLQELEFPSAMHKARKIALLKAGGIPTMSKLFAVTGQNNRKNSGKRSIDTEILLREAQANRRDSKRYMQAVARMNYFHSRYRQAGKILDDDMLHTLGTNVVEIFRIVDGNEWRALNDVERCAVGVFHKNLGDDLLIPYTALPSSEVGWRDGIHFAEELVEWTVRYEERVAKPVATGDQYVRVYVDLATSKLPKFVTLFTRKMLGYELDDVMRTSLNLEKPGICFSAFLAATGEIQKFIHRHLALPRPSLFAVKAIHENSNPKSGLYNFDRHGLQPWYVAPSFSTKWGGSVLLFRAFGGRVPDLKNERFHPEGYNLLTIGPEPQKGKGMDDMTATVEFLKSRDITECPFQKHRAS